MFLAIVLSIGRGILGIRNNVLTTFAHNNTVNIDPMEKTKSDYIFSIRLLHVFKTDLILI